VIPAGLGHGLICGLFLGPQIRAPI
jgi:hypothetical protein